MRPTLVTVTHHATQSSVMRGSHATDKTLACLIAGKTDHSPSSSNGIIKSNGVHENQLINTNAIRHDVSTTSAMQNTSGQREALLGPLLEGALKAQWPPGAERAGPWLQPAWHAPAGRGGAARPSAAPSPCALPGAVGSGAVQAAASEPALARWRLLGAATL